MSRKRESWMTGDSDGDFSFLTKKNPPSRKDEGPAMKKERRDEPQQPPQQPAKKPPPAPVGDGGLQWRLMKLKRVHEQAEREGRPVEEVALERYGSLEEFRAALRERQEAGGSTSSSRAASISGARSRDSSRPSTSGSGFRRPGESPSSTPRRLSSDYRTATREEMTEADKKRDQLRYAVPSQEVLKALEKEQLERDLVPTSSSRGNEGNERLSAAPVMTQDELNKLRAKIMKAKLKNDSQTVAELEAEYQRQVDLMAAAESGEKTQPANVVTLPSFDSRGRYRDIGSSSSQQKEQAFHGKHGKARKEEAEERGEHDMSVQDILRAEKMSGQTADEEMARRILKDSKFDESLDYLDQQSKKLAKPVQLSASQKRSKAILDYSKTQAILDRCWYCLNEEHRPRVPIVAVGVRTYLALPKTIPFCPGHCLIVPAQHNTTTLDCEDDEWDEIRNFMKCLLRMFHADQKGVVFIETAFHFKRQYHTYIECIPVPYSQMDAVPGFFKQSILQQAEEWSQNRKLIDTSGNGFRRSLVPNLPYFHVWFGLDKGYGHVIEDESNFPGYFGKEVLAGLMQVSSERWRKPRLMTDEEMKSAENAFKKKFKPYDWTASLYSGA